MLLRDDMGGRPQYLVTSNQRPVLLIAMATSDVDALFLSFQQAVVGRYSLERELGRGGMGVVYLAREVLLDRPVAIKLLPPELAARPELRDRFMREARTAARLSHPYIVPIHAVDEIGGFVFIVMAYVDGGTLAQRLAAHGPLPAHDVTRIMREVAWALAYAHAQGVVHRDIKPANILLERGTGRAMVADFGIARLAETTGDTAAGVVLGTPEFMSPEQATAEELDGRSDLYALGIVAYLALTGTLPFTANTAQGVIAQHLTQPPPPVATVARGIPRSLAQAIDKCLQKQASARFPNGEALADALAPGIDKRPEVPIPIRVFLDRRRMGMLIIPATFTVPLVTAVAQTIAKHGGHVAPALTIAAMIALAVGFPFSVIVYRLRKLLRVGYGMDDITAALRASFERHREEFLYVYGGEATTRERLLTFVGASGLVIGGAGVIAAIVMPHQMMRFVAPVGLIGLYTGMAGTAFSSRWRRLRRGTGSLWSKVWSGPVGKQLARIASIKLGDRAVLADRPTEMAIAMSAEAMFAAFPKELRESLGDIPQVLHGLEAHARAIRSRIEDLDTSLAEAQRGPARAVSTDRQDALVVDLTEAQERAQARLEQIVTALENLRLDLLRLRAGGGSMEGITLDLAAAREFGQETDRLLESGREVEQALALRGRSSS
jgi:eukaryotic-like serine/threonine-protein kinase